MSDWKTSEQLSHEIYSSIEKVADRADWWSEGFVGVKSNNGLPFAIYFNEEQLKAVFEINLFDFVFEQATYMVYAKSKEDATLKAACLTGHLQALFKSNFTQQRFDMLDVLQPNIRRWEEQLSEREPTAQAG